MYSELLAPALAKKSVASLFLRGFALIREFLQSEMTKKPRKLASLYPGVLRYFDNQNTIRHSFDLEILCCPIMLILPSSGNSDIFQRTPSTL